jgi:hypothetical protein
MSRMEWDKFIQTPAYKQLKSAEERLYVKMHFDTQGDSLTSYQFAFRPKKASSARVGSYAILQRKSVREALAVLYQMTAGERLAQTLEDEMRRDRHASLESKRKTVLTIAALRGVRLPKVIDDQESQSLESTEAPAPIDITAVKPPRWNVGDVLEQAGKRYRVVGFYEDGAPNVELVE